VRCREGFHTSCTDLGIRFGATDVVTARGEEGIAAVLELTRGEGSQVVIEAVGHMPAHQQAYGVVRPGGVISRVGVPQYEDAPIGFGSLFGKNVTLTGGPAPVRGYLEDAIVVATLVVRPARRRTTAPTAAPATGSAPDRTGTERFDPIAATPDPARC
jgi:threonine dehydrogenase-like Zn-dependent dehydrogenase